MKYLCLVHDEVVRTEKQLAYYLIFVLFKLSLVQFWDRKSRHKTLFWSAAACIDNGGAPPGCCMDKFTSCRERGLNK